MFIFKALLSTGSGTQYGNYFLTENEVLFNAINTNPILLHGKVAAEFVKRRFKINDSDILTGIAFHTSGYKDLGIYGKVLFLADSLEETRTYPNVNKLRELAFKDIEVAYFEVLRNKIIYALSRDLLILPESVESWNNLIMKKKGGVI